MSEWTKEDASLEGADPVIWYSFGVTHVVRTEDFPCMPVESVGFALKPVGFFTGGVLFVLLHSRFTGVQPI